MRVVIQRVSSSEVEIEGKVYGKIGKGFLVLVGFAENDTLEKVNWMCTKIIGLRIFSDKDGKMNLSIKDIGGEILLVSNFTLYADSSRGNRPNFTSAAKPETATPLYDYMVQELRKTDIKIETGIFGAMMNIQLTNDGPVTIIIDK